jgi:thiol-disulfide isomerase/thioredoxin
MNYKNVLTSLTVCILSLNAYAQHIITGNFPLLAGQQVRLVGFEGFGIYTIDSTRISEQGVFKLKYAGKDRGMGYLAAEDNKAYFVVLANENIQLEGEVLSVPESIVTVSGKENKQFIKYAEDHRKLEQALSAWVYLQKIYQGDSLFSIQEYPQKAIESEMLRIKQQDNDFLKSLDPGSYVRWYLPIRKLLSSVSTIAQYHTEEIPAAIAEFRGLDYIDKKLYKSGLLRDLIESHYWLIENSRSSLDSVYIEMNISIDRMIDNLVADDKKLNEITEYLFMVFEKRSLFGASEYLALKLLNEQSCTINNDFAAQLESYRAMKKGNIAPDIVFSGDVIKSGSAIKTPNRLSDIQSAFKVVIFGASWCPKCADELAQLLPLYERWKSKGVEVVFISLDTDKAVFKNFTSIFPFISMCDYKKWDTKVVKDYKVFATPTIFLLDNKREILLRPNSVNQLDSWVDWYLVKGDK